MILAHNNLCRLQSVLFAAPSSIACDGNMALYNKDLGPLTQILIHSSSNLVVWIEAKALCY
jgi:hypothetical protein